LAEKFKSAPTEKSVAISYLEGEGEDEDEGEEILAKNLNP